MYINTLIILFLYQKSTNMEHKVEVAKKILTIANEHDGKVYGGFVRDVIVPRINDPNCDVSFKDVDIWFKDKIAENYFVRKLYKFFKIEREIESSPWNTELDYSNNEKGINFFRSQYRIYTKDKFLFHIDLITSAKLPVNDFYVNTLTYKHTEKGFEKLDGDICGTQPIINKVAVMFENYNPEGPMYYERINRIFFSKGWSVRCKGKHEQLSVFIKKNKLKITEVCLGTVYDYIPIEIKEDITSKLIVNNASKLDIADKDILRLIFNNGLDVLNGKFYNSIEDKELQSIYKLGLEDYRFKIDNLLK